MRLTLRNLRSIIREALEDDGYTEETPLGRYAFANDRTDASQVPKEPDTPEEKDLVAALDRFFRKNERTPGLVKGLKKAMASGKYTDVIVEPPRNAVVYRGLTFSSIKFVGRLLNLPATTPEEEEHLGSLSHVEGDFDYVPAGVSGKVSSWTLDKAAAEEFASTREPTWWSIVLEATVADNPGTFISCPDGLYKTKMAADYEEESEVIALGTVKFKKAYWWPGNHRIQGQKK
jgi:uncharacterized RmlC-like cupin family protein